MLTEAEAFCISASYLKQAGANRIIVMVTHGIFVDNSIDLIEKSCIDEVIVTNSVNFDSKGSSKVRSISFCEDFNELSDGVKIVKICQVV